MFFKRSYESEMIDLDPSGYTESEYFDCLNKLDRVGRWLGGYQATLYALSIMKTPPKSILDVGCGGGFFAIEMALRYPEATILGIDINPLAIAFANQYLLKMVNPPKNVRFELKMNPELDEAPKSYDVVCSMLVCHHLNDDILIDFIKRACLVAKHKVIFNDLQRSMIGYAAFKFISPLVFRNRLVMHDGLLSIRKAFFRKEWVHYLERAGVAKDRYHISWKWAFRFIVDINTYP